MYLVLGATGNIGSRVVDQLTKQSQKVRVLVRDASRATGLPEGVDIKVGDLDDQVALFARYLAPSQRHIGTLE